MLICGDLLKELEKVSDIDLSITSPPYNKNNHVGYLTKNKSYDVANDSLGEMEYQEQQIEVLDKVHDKTVAGGSFFYNHTVRYQKGCAIFPLQWIAKSKWRIRQEIIWYRKKATNLRGYRFWPVEERIYWLYKPVNEKDIGREILSKHALLTSVWEVTPETRSVHPCPFPVEIPARIIYSLFDNEKDKHILDPYCGSGTVGVVTKYFGHKFTGIDISEDYVEISKKRIEEMSEKDIKKIEIEIANHKVLKSYKERKETSKRYYEKNLRIKQKENKAGHD